MSVDRKETKTKNQRKISGPLLSLAGFILLLYISWIYFGQTPRTGEEEKLHSLLQDRFQTLISDRIADRHPEVTEIIFHKVWTQKINQQEIKIFFNYSLQTKGETRGETVIEGEALMESSIHQKGLWIIRDFQVNNSTVNFSDPLVIKAKPE